MNDVEKVNPYDNDREKGVQVEEMFDSIAPAYDLMNDAMTFGMHRRWLMKALKKTIESSDLPENPKILDIATGTGEVAFRLHDMIPDAIITGIDLSEGMLALARKKLEKLTLPEQRLIAFGKADCLNLPFHDGEFNLISVAYGVRNFSDLSKGLSEMRRVLRQGGSLCLIELSVPEGKFLSGVYSFYTTRIIPLIGKFISGDKRAYSYLPESIAACPQREEMKKLLHEAGFEKVDWKSLSLGAVTYYIAK